MQELIGVISHLILPPTALLLLAVVGLIRNKTKIGMIILTFSLLLLLMLSLPIVELKLSEYWESYPVFRSENARGEQVIVVIGGGLQAPAVEYTNAATVKPGTLLRIRYAAKLAKDTGLRILTSGGKTLKQLDLSEAGLMADVLQKEFGAVVSWQEPESRNTAENARFSHRLLQQHGIDKIILVTEAYHMPRAMSEFRKAGFLVEAAPTAFYRHSDGKIGLEDFIPSVFALEYGFLVSHEIVGMLWYRIRYS